MIRKREPRWQSAADRARVAAELIEEAASLTDESTIASPADVARAGLPPPISAELPSSAPPGGGAAPAPDAPPAGHTLDDALARDPDNVALLVERAARLGAAAHYSAAQLDYARALRADPAHGEALMGLGVLLRAGGSGPTHCPRYGVPRKSTPAGRRPGITSARRSIMWTISRPPRPPTSGRWSSSPAMRGRCTASASCSIA